MQLNDALRRMISRAGLGQLSLAVKAGYSTQSAVSSPLKKNDMNVSTLVRLADAAGFDVMLVQRIPMEGEGAIRIEPRPAEEAPKRGRPKRDDAE